MSRVYLADKETLDQVRENTQLILAGLSSLIEGAAPGDKFAKSKVVDTYFAMRRTGKVFGVKFNDYEVSPSPLGTRLYDAVGMVAVPGTDKVPAKVDFDQYDIFNGLEVNGYLDEDGEFVVTYLNGEHGFDRERNDTYILFATHWFKLSIDGTGEELSITDTKREGYAPSGGAIRPDKSVRGFVPIAKYPASEGEDEKAASISGKVAFYNMSHNAALTKMREKGTQYCSITTHDTSMLQRLFEVAFATRHSQSIMAGCTSYNYQYPAAVIEQDVERIIVTNAQAANFIVGSRVSIGRPTSLSNDSPNLDRGAAGMHSLANRVLITAIEPLEDGANTAIYVDNGGQTFSTTTNIEDDVEYKCYITTMPWHTGMTDSVLGSCGSPVSNTNGKYPMKLFGVEMQIGQYEVISNVIQQITMEDDVFEMTPHIAYDCTKFATSITEDYETVGYKVFNTKNEWTYISKLGFDPKHPSARFGIAGGATSTTGYCDSQHTGAEAAGLRECLFGGRLNLGSHAGLWIWYLYFALSTAGWSIAARLSATGRCGKAAA